MTLRSSGSVHVSDTAVSNSTTFTAGPRLPDHRFISACLAALNAYRGLRGAHPAAKKTHMALKVKSEDLALCQQHSQCLCALCKLQHALLMELQTLEASSLRSAHRGQD